MIASAASMRVLSRRGAAIALQAGLVGTVLGCSSVQGGGSDRAGSMTSTATTGSTGSGTTGATGSTATTSASSGTGGSTTTSSSGTGGAGGASSSSNGTGGASSLAARLEQCSTESANLRGMSRRPTWQTVFERFDPERPAECRVATT
jgi:hypothetical protein